MLGSRPTKVACTAQKTDPVVQFIVRVAVTLHDAESRKCARSGARAAPAGNVWAIRATWLSVGATEADTGFALGVPWSVRLAASWQHAWQARTLRHKERLMSSIQVACLVIGGVIVDPPPVLPAGIAYHGLEKQSVQRGV